MENKEREREGEEERELKRSKDVGKKEGKLLFVSLLTEFKGGEGRSRDMGEGREGGEKRGKNIAV